MLLDHHRNTFPDWSGSLRRLGLPECFRTVLQSLYLYGRFTVGLQQGCPRPSMKFDPYAEWSDRKMSVSRWIKNLRNYTVRQFWDRFESTNVTADKLALLMSMSKLRFEIPSKSLRKRNPVARACFDRLKAHHPMEECCAVCSGRPKVRHHIVTLANGGSNHKLNLISLCNSCHSQIHPWLKKLN
jgi:hypothetical protein